MKKGYPDLPYHHSHGDSRLVHFGFPTYDEYHNEEKNMKKEWIKIEDSIFKFEKLKDSIEGEFIGKEKGKTFDNEVYKIKDAKGKVWTVFSTTVMQSQMSSVKVGQSVKIVLVDLKENKKKGQNDIKIFEVYTSE